MNILGHVSEDTPVLHIALFHLDPRPVAIRLDAWLGRTVWTVSRRRSEGQRPRTGGRTRLDLPREPAFSLVRGRRETEELDISAHGILEKTKEGDDETNRWTLSIGCRPACVGYRGWLSLFAGGSTERTQKM